MRFPAFFLIFFLASVPAWATRYTRPVPTVLTTASDIADAEKLGASLKALEDVTNSCILARKSSAGRCRCGATAGLTALKITYDQTMVEHPYWSSPLLYRDKDGEDRMVSLLKIRRIAIVCAPPAYTTKDTDRK